MQEKSKGKGTIWELSHAEVQAMKMGTKGKSLSIPLSPQQQSLYDFSDISIPRFIPLQRF